MKNDLKEYASKSHKASLTIKYLDPKKAIRACPSNSADVAICHSLAFSAVHSVMAGFTDFACGFVRC
jgi:6-phosphofructokinase 1